MHARAERTLVSGAAALVAAATVVGAAGASATAAPARPTGRTGPAGLGAAGSPAWQLSYLGSATSQLNSVAAINRRDAWAAGYFGKLYNPVKALVLHWNGAKWTAARVPEPRALRAAGVAASSARDVWLFGGNNKILRWNGHKWLTVPGLAPISESQPDYAPAQGAVVLSASDVWLLRGVTDRRNGTVSTAVSHWNGHRWRTWTVRHIAGSGIGAVSATDAWLVGTKAMGIKEPLVAYRFTGRSWLSVGMRHPAEYYYSPDVVMASARDVWVATDDAAAGGSGLSRPALVLHWRSGHGWTQSQPGPMTSGGPSGFVTDGAGGVWDGGSADWTGHSWVTATVGASLQPYAGFYTEDLARSTGSTQLWGVGAAPVPGGQWAALIIRYR